MPVGTARLNISFNLLIPEICFPLFQPLAEFDYRLHRQMSNSYFYRNYSGWLISNAIIIVV